MLAGGESFGGDAVVPGNAAESYLYSMVHTFTESDFAMPPKEAEQLTEEAGMVDSRLDQRRCSMAERQTNRRNLRPICGRRYLENKWWSQRRLD